MKVAEIAVTPVLAKSDTLGRACQTEGNDFWRSWGQSPKLISPRPVRPFKPWGFSRPILAIEGAHRSPVFISSNVSNSGARSMTSFAAPFNPVPSV
jgi:hypothetical protein